MKIIEGFKYKLLFIFLFHFFHSILFGQIKWINIDSLYQPLPSSLHIYFTDQPIDTAPFRAYYLIADLKDKNLEFTTDTTYQRRLTPKQFFERNSQPLVVVNCTFFSFQTNQNLNVVIKNGKLLGYNLKSVLDKKDSFYHYITRSAIGISAKRKADVAWLYTDSSKRWPYSLTCGPTFLHGNTADPKLKNVKWAMPCSFNRTKKKWKMKTAVGGGPALVYQSEIRITNEQEMMFTGNAINDKHPRTAMGYTKDNKLVILMIEGRNSVAHGATLRQEAQILKDLGCWEALNLDGGGSSCMLVNGKETIRPSDKEGQRPVPTVFIINQKNNKHLLSDR